MVKTDTVMKLAHFHDFYFLQALEAATKNAIDANPELEFSKPVEKFLTDLDKVTEKIVPNMALRTFMYLYAACVGEARHTTSAVTETLFLKKSKRSREDAFATITDYPPTPENLQVLVDLFSQSWRSGYGGSAWRNIAVALTEYGKSPDAAWLDHVVDLQHNNGTAFSKPEGKETIFFSIEYEDSRFGQFLDYKFREDILTTTPYWKGYLDVSPRIFNLLTRYSNVFKVKMPHVVQKLEDLTPYEVEWGKKSFKVGRKAFSWCSVGNDGNPSLEYILNEVDMYSSSVFAMTKDEFKAYTERKLKTAKSLIESKGVKSASLIKKLTKEVDKYYAKNLDNCKMPKAPITYQIMPCTISKGKAFEIIAHFDLPYQEGYGTKTETGFDVIVSYYGNVKKAAKCYFTKNYGEPVMYLDDNYAFVGSKTMEALID